jgi:hypothetical protein
MPRALINRLECFRGVRDSRIKVLCFFLSRKKILLFCKKEAKNFYDFADAAGDARTKWQKFFASFFQKRRVLPSFNHKA